MKFFIKNFFSKCDQIRSFLRNLILKKSLMENLFFFFFFFAVHATALMHFKAKQVLRNLFSTNEGIGSERVFVVSSY